MRLENAVAADVLERILSAYGFTMQKELSDKLGIAKSNVASWLQRGQVPGNVLVQCALDTGADVQWLVTGEFANANIHLSKNMESQSLLNGPSLIKKILQSGGRPVLQRIMEAYGFKTQKELSQYLEISTATISTWIRREYFPGDIVITCALETNKSLMWLATGNIEKRTPLTTQVQSESIKIELVKISTGELKKNGFLNLDAKLTKGQRDNLIAVENGLDSWLFDTSFPYVSNGVWLLKIDGMVDIYNLMRKPKDMVSISNSYGCFECSINNISPIGIAIIKLTDLTSLS